ncbi:hypothetical protein [Streptomyces sp. NPDC004685]
MARCPVRAFGRLGIGLGSARLGSARELSTDGPPGPVEAVFRDSKIGEIGQIHEGTDEIRKWITARYIFRSEITG